MDLYRVLGLTHTADTLSVRNAYRALAKRYHPDVSTLPDAEERFVRITEAYEILSDPIKRARYDRTQASPSPRTAPPRQQARYEKHVHRDKRDAQERAAKYGRMRYQQFDHEYFDNPVQYFAPKIAGCFGIIVAVLLVMATIGIILEQFGLPVGLVALLILPGIPFGVWLSSSFDMWHNRRQRERKQGQGWS
ncbi:MAG: DnaJ domain-containing protein [Flavobacteriales bacterium]